MITKHTNGTVSELMAATYYAKSGCSVYLPVDGHGEYDMIVDDGDKLKKVQVKTVYFDNSKKRWLVSLVTSHIRGSGRRTNKKYTANSFDELCAVHAESNSVYLIPISIIAGRRSATLYPDRLNGPLEKHKHKL